MTAPQALRVLYVDDEPINLKLMRDVFALILGRPEQVDTVESGEAALERLPGGGYDVVIADQRMHGMSGTDLLARTRELWPGIGRMLLTGFPNDREVQAALRSGLAHAVVAKPWRPRDLEGVLAEVVARTRTTRT